MSGGVCVIIAVHNAEGTIARAIRSALAEAEVTEVVVVDDASTDETADVAERTDDGSDRLRVLRLDRNVGPAAARNAGLEVSKAAYVAVLDSDDFLLPGRFTRLLAQSEWDLAADNIVFLQEERANQPLQTGTGKSGFRSVGAVEFVRGNLEGRVARGELGFLKPVMSRAFLDQHDLRYDPAMWLGEDYDLYVRMLLCGARFKLTHDVGYGAIVRPNSLSGKHRTADLEALLRASQRHLETRDLDQALRRAIRGHARQTEAKFLLRAFLDRKAQKGIGAALGFAAWPPRRFMPIAFGIARDKLHLRSSAVDTEGHRFLLPVDVGATPLSQSAR